MRRWRLNSGYCGTTDQRLTQAGTIPAMKKFMEQFLSRYLDPTDISATNLLLWYAADKEVLYSNGNSVNTITNFGVGTNATAFTTGPTYVVNVRNALPIYRFANNSCRTTASYSFTDFTFYVVFNNTGGNQEYERLLDHDFVNGFWFGRNGNNVNSFGGGVRESSDPYGVYVTATDGQWNIIGNQRVGTTHNVWNNGNFANRSFNTVQATATSVNPVGIGGWFNGSNSQQANGIDIAEIVFYDIALDDTQKYIIEGYLAHKWGLKANLPENHPYKNEAPVNI